MSTRSLIFLILRKLGAVTVIPFLVTACYQKAELKFDDQNLSSNDAGILDCSNRTKIARTDLRRLTRNEYLNSLRDLFGSDLLSQVSSHVDAIPKDLVGINLTYDTAVRGSTSATVDGFFAVSDRLAELAASSPITLSTMSPCLTTLSTVSVASAESCVQTMVTSFGKKVFRRPLAAGEITDYVGIYRALVREGQSPTDSLQGVISALINSPHFLNKVEINGTPTAQSNVFALTQHELATRLSYMLWNSTPDDALLSAADRGELGTTAQIDSKVRAMATSPKMREAVKNFLNGWLLVGATADPNFSSQFLNGIDPTGLKQAMINEMESFALHHILDTKGKFSDLMTSKESSMPARNIAAIYGIQQTETTTVFHSGLITRAARLNDGRIYSSPIHRGVFIRRQLLCDQVASPDPSKLPPGSLNPPPFDPTKSARERWNAKTSGTSCIGCHSQINALGYALESYDSIGRVRTQEDIYDLSGQLVNSLPIDTSVDVVLDTRSVRVNHADDLARELATSPKANLCFAKQWYRYSHGRKESRAEDGCALQDMEMAMNATGGSAFELMIRLALNPEFRYVRVK